MRTSLSRTLILFGCLLSLLIAVICAAISAYTNHYTQAQNITYLQYRTENDAETIDSCFTEISLRMHRVAEHSVIKNFAQDTAADRYAALENIKIILANISDAMPMVMDVRLVMPRNSTLHIMTDNSLYTEADIACSELLGDELMLRRVSGMTEITVVKGIPILAMYCPVMRNGHIIGQLVCLVRADTLLRDTLQQDDCAFALLEDDEVLCTTDAGAFFIAAGMQKTDAGSCYVAHCPLKNLPVTLAVRYGEAQFREEDKVVRTWLTRFALVCILLIISMLLFVHHSIVSPVHAIAEQMRKLERMHLQMEEPSSNRSEDNRNEIIRLTEGLNAMMSRLDLSTRNILKMQESMHRAETQHLRERILFLQSQINPHFLYNTLECLRGMAAYGSVQQVREITLHMASIYRYCIGEADNVTLKEELDCLASYMRIIEMRYDNCYTWKNEVDERLYDEPAVRMMLQPLAENALRHGFLEPNRARGCITVRAYKEDSGIRVSVLNDGDSIAQETLSRLNANLRAPYGTVEHTNEHIGLFNVSDRLRLLYGENSFVSVSNHENGGVRVELFINAGKFIGH